MATAIQIITRAMRSINVLGSDETPSSEMASDAFDSLNDLLESWANEKLMIYQLVLEGFPLIVGQASYTIGPAGNFNTVRPISIDNAYIRWQGLDYPMGIVTTEQYDNIPLKTIATQMPCVMILDAGFPLSTIKMWPTPSDNTAQLFIESRKPFTAFTSYTDQVNMPPGYDRALRYNLAMELIPEYGIVNSSPQLARMAATAKKAIKRVNWSPPILEIDESIPQWGGYYDSKGNYL